MFKDAAKGLCKQQSQDGASENVTVNTSTKLEQVTACSFSKCFLVPRSGNCYLNEAEDRSNFFPFTTQQYRLHCGALCPSSLPAISLTLQRVPSLQIEQLLPTSFWWRVRGCGSRRAQSSSDSIHGSQQGRDNC